MQKLDLELAAETFWENGIVVLPWQYRTVNGHVEKPTNVDAWKQWQSRPQTRQEFEALKLDTADGIGLLCGCKTKSGLYLGALDYDVKPSPSGVMPTKESLELGKKILAEMPPTKKEQTQSGGVHLYYLSRTPVKTDKTFKDKTAIEFLGAYIPVYVYPSKGYKTLNNHDFTVLNDLQNTFYTILAKHGLEKEKKPRVQSPTTQVHNHLPIDVLRQRNVKLNDLMNGFWKEYKYATRSEGEAAIVTTLIYVGFSDPEIRDAMQNCEIGKWQQAGDAYQDITIRKAREFAAKHTPQHEQNSTAEELGLWPEIPEPIECEFETLIEELETFVKEHVEFQKEEEHATFIAFILLTYIAEAFETCPYLFFYGVKRSGKTRALDVLKELCYKAMYGANVSTAAVYFATEQYHPTLLLDETEIYTTGEKNANETLHLLNSGYKRGQKAFRVETNEDGERYLRGYDVYGPKGLAGTRGLLDTLEDRVIKFTMAKNTTPINYRIKHEKAKNLRAKLMAWRKTKIDTLDTLDPSEPSILDALTTYRNTNCSTIDNYNSVETMAFDGRLRELFEPLYLCLFASKGSKESRLSILQKNLIGHLDDLLRQREIEEESGLDAEILRIIIGCNHTDGRFGTKQVADVFNSCRREKSQWKTATIGHMISRLGFQRCRMNDGRRGYQYDEKLVERLKKRYKIGDVNG